MIGPMATIPEVGNPYYAVIPGSLGDKGHLGEHMVPGSVLDVGPGDGHVADVLRSQGFTVTGLDVAPRPGVADVRTGWADEAAAIFGPDSFDNVLACSVLHEVYSFGNADGVPGLSAVRSALRSFFEVLRPGGRLVIRDGVRDFFPAFESKVNLPGHWEQLARVFAEVRGTVAISDGHLYGPSSEVAEFLSAGVWGPDLIEREAAETFGWSMSSNVNLTVMSASGWRASMIHSHTWTSPLYQSIWERDGLVLTHLSDEGESHDWPKTHGLWVFQ